MGAHFGTPALSAPHFGVKLMTWDLMLYEISVLSSRMQLVPSCAKYRVEIIGAAQHHAKQAIKTQNNSWNSNNTSIHLHVSSNPLPRSCVILSTWLIQGQRLLSWNEFGVLFLCVFSLFYIDPRTSEWLVLYTSESVSGNCVCILSVRF